jgi:hypothetical protein
MKSFMQGVSVQDMRLRQTFLTPETRHLTPFYYLYDSYITKSELETNTLHEKRRCDETTDPFTLKKPS